MAFQEFDLIQRFFKQKRCDRQDVRLGIGDDGAILQVPYNRQLVVTIDTLVAGHHFPENTLPEDIGYKSLAVSLSDLAAMGADPAWVLLALTLPVAEESWLTSFAQGFFSLLHQFHLQLVGGDTTCGPLSITVQAMGSVPFGKALCRSGAQVGDNIYVTGSLGDAGLALAYLQGRSSLHLTKNQISMVLDRLNRPTPRVEAGIALRDLASSAIDISDGLLADLGHILSESQVGAVIRLMDLPLSVGLRELSSKKNKIGQWALNAGDDYELCFTVPISHEKRLQEGLRSINCPFTCIGEIKRDLGLSVLHKDGSPFIFSKKGYQHFS